MPNSEFFVKFFDVLCNKIEICDKLKHYTTKNGANCRWFYINCKGDYRMAKRIFLVFFCATLIMTGFSGCKKNKNSPENQVIKYNLESEPRTLDPQVCNDYAANIVIMNIFEGLVRLDESGNVTPGVATSWDVSADGMTYKFHLREDAAWSDKAKTPVTAQDFVFGLQRALDKYTNSPNAYTLYCIKNARKVNIDGAPADSLGVFASDEHTVAIELEYPMENFLSLLATAPTMPCNKAFFEGTNGQYGLEAATIISNGAFKVKPRYGWSHYNSLSLVKNENYLGANAPVPAGVDFTIGKDLTDAVSLITTSAIDAALLASEEQVTEAKRKNLGTIDFKDTLWGLAFNTQDALFANLNVRLGFLEALNRDHILSMIPENCEVTESLVPDGLIVNGQNFRSVAGKFPCLTADPEAKSHFDAGLQQLKLKTLPKVTILCPENPSIKAIISNAIENLNGNLGFYFNMEPVSEGVLKSRVASMNYQVALVPIAVESPSALDFLNTFKSGNSKNIANLNSPEYDKLINSAASANAKDAYKPIVAAEKYLIDNAVFYPMYTQSRFFAWSNKVKGLIFHNYGQGVDFFFATKTK